MASTVNILFVLLMALVDQQVIGQSTVNDELKHCDQQQQNVDRTASECLIQQQQLQLDEMKTSLEQLEHQLDQFQRLVTAQRRRIAPEGGCIFGLASSTDMLYVDRSIAPVIEVYDIDTFQLVNRLTIPELGGIEDLVWCHKSNVLYVVDSWRNQTFVVDERGVVVRWSTVDMPGGLSVNSQLNVVITFSDTRKLREFTSSGQLVREITLQPDILRPLHAIQLGDDQYAVTHGNHSDATGLHRLLIVDRNGRIVRSFGTRQGSDDKQLYTPIRMAAFGGKLLVSNINSARLLMFNATSLAFIREVLSAKEQGVGSGSRMSLSEDGNRLYMADNTWRSGKCTTGHFKMVNITWA